MRIVLLLLLCLGCVACSYKDRCSPGGAVMLGTKPPAGYYAETHMGAA